MATRKIIEIDEEKCDGCGQCVTACAEGAIEIRDGKARLVSESYCDGLGACLGECPQDAIRVIEREAAAFDEELVHKHLAGSEISPAVFGGCPGAAVRGAGVSPATFAAGTAAPQSALGQWPIQLRLVPPSAPFLRGADLLLVADCVPFAMADFHRLLRGKGDSPIFADTKIGTVPNALVIGCPKLDDAGGYVEKLSAILAKSGVRSLTVVHMEVPCCTGLMRIAEAARQRSGSSVPLKKLVVSIRGQEVGLPMVAAQ